MDAWPAMRLRRAKEQPIACEGLECRHDGSFIFNMRGSMSDRYTVEIHEHIDLCPPTCDCLDQEFRPDLMCKHIVFCLLKMGVDDALLQELYWEPASQDEVYDILMNAPDVVDG